MAPRAETPILPVRLAAFGTLSNGSDTQLLAEPAGSPLTPGERQIMRAFFDLAWRGVQHRELPYFAFFHINEGSRWCLTRTDRLGQGAMGWIIVVWFAIIERNDLARIHWSVHRALESALPPPGLPAAGTRMAPLDAVLGQADYSRLKPYRDRFDHLRDRIVGHANPVIVRIQQPADATADPLNARGALFGLWSRLGRSGREDRSFSTWTGVDAQDAAGMTIFDVMFDDIGHAPLPGRVVLEIGAAEAVPALRLEQRIVRGLDGITCDEPTLLPSRAETAAAASALADAWEQEPGFSGVIATLQSPPHPQHVDALGAAAFELLARRAASVPETRKGQVFAQFIADAAALIDSPQGAVIRARIAVSAQTAEALGRLPAAVLDQLVEPLFGTTGPESAFADAAVAQVIAAPELDWTTWYRLAYSSRARGEPAARPLMWYLAIRAPDSIARQRAIAAFVKVHKRDVFDAWLAAPTTQPSHRALVVASLAMGRQLPTASAPLLQHIKYRRDAFALKRGLAASVGHFRGAVP